MLTWNPVSYTGRIDRDSKARLLFSIIPTTNLDDRS